ncbi:MULTISPECIES: virion core protein, T7 gp14 family [unclassified Janthinobacterium]|uniref:virion core protein, T7 gp14 family n=1 Tax=unclassified Janthinobacterium TaxID=2610881 RepID=UPI000344A9FD|nr:MULTISPECIES: hypothetical protein [unclassified Janthinobacterium]MEC5161722.1 hypothetical protein [Janthinobacterium sp. CG_S6]
MGLAITAAGAISSAGAAYGQAQNQRSSLEYQASVAQSNAAFAEASASDAVRSGQTAEENHALKTGALFGAQRAQLAANGVDLGSGSANEILTTTKFMSERDALQIHDNAMMQAWGYRTQASSYVVDAQRAEGAADTISPWMAAGTSLLTGASNVASQWDAKANLKGTADFGTTVKNKWSSMWGNG